jgi:8-oxo-dGTP diphosphatase
VLTVTEKYFICVDGVYIKAGKILLLKRNVEPFKGFWHLIGGHVEENETLKQALQREFKEETSLDVQVGEIIDARIEKTFDRTKIIVAFKVTSAEGEIKLNSESEDFGWFTNIPSNSVYDYAKYFTKK